MVFTGYENIVSYKLLYTSYSRLSPQRVCEYGKQLKKRRQQRKTFSPWWGSSKRTKNESVTSAPTNVHTHTRTHMQLQVKTSFVRGGRAGGDIQGPPLLARQKTRKRRDTLNAYVRVFVSLLYTHTHQRGLRKSASVVVSRLNASNHLALIFFLIFIFIFNCFSLSFFSADVALSHYAKPFVFVIVLQLSFKVAFSRCVHV